MTALPVLTETDWARMGWRARQQWLHASTALMRQVRAELAAAARDDRSRLAHTLGHTLDTERTATHDDARGADRLTTATVEVYTPTTEPDIDAVAVLRAMTGERVDLTNAERRDAVRRLHAQGLGDREIAERIGTNRRQVRRDRDRFGLPSNIPANQHHATRRAS